MTPERGCGAAAAAAVAAATLASTLLPLPRPQQVGHSLGAGTAVLLGHLIRQGDPEAMELMKGIKLHAVGIATPAVLTADLAEGCSSYVTSVVLQHDMVPRFSIYNVFLLKEEMVRGGAVQAYCAGPGGRRARRSC